MIYLRNNNNQIFDHIYMGTTRAIVIAVVAIKVDEYEGKGLWRAYIGAINQIADQEAEQLQFVADHGHKLNRAQALAMFPAINPDLNRNPI